METDVALIDYDRIEASVESLRESFPRAKPPHVTVDDLFDPVQLAEAAAHYPTFAEMQSTTIGGTATNDTQLANRAAAHPSVRRIAEELMSPRWLSWLRALTGKADLRADPDDSWGVIRQYGDSVQTDPRAPSRHKTKPLRRTLSSVVFLTPGWEEEWEGQLQLWDGANDGVRADIVPVFNRVCVFENAASLYHMPLPSRLPAGVTRKNIVVWFYQE